MDDEFDDVGLSDDDDLAGEGELPELEGGDDADLDLDAEEMSEPSGRPSGGARARVSPMSRETEQPPAVPKASAPKAAKVKAAPKKAAAKAAPVAKAKAKPAKKKAAPAKAKRGGIKRSMKKKAAPKKSGKAKAKGGKKKARRR